MTANERVMQGEPKVSIIVPVYNVEAYLERSIASILAQTIQDFEVIFVNDGSTDASAEVLARYTDPRFRVFSQENAGQSVARNRGMLEARGEYVYFFDSDDVVHPQLLEITTQLLEAHGAEMVSFGHVVNGAEELCQTKINPETLQFTVVDNPYYLSAQNVLVWAKLFKRSLLEGITFYPNIKFEDVLFTCEVLTRRPKTVLLDANLYAWTINPESTMHKAVYPNQIKFWHICIDNIARLYRVPGYEEEWDYMLTQTIPNLLKQQFNHCRRTKGHLRRAMFEALADELIDLQAKGILQPQGHKHGRYKKYLRLIRKQQDIYAVAKAFDTICGEPIAPFVPPLSEIPCNETSDRERLCKHPVVSVYMLTYKHEAYIAEAIEAVMAQKTDFEFELILGEDASPDRTREICFEYQKKYPDKIRVLWSEKNVGVSSNDARVLNACRGEYVAYCEGDDYWIDANKLQKQVETIRTHQAGMCIARNLISEDGQMTEAQPADGLFITQRETHYKYFHTTTYLVRTDLLKSFNVLFPKVTKWFDSMIVQTIYTMAPIVYMGDTVSVYRMTGAGLWTCLDVRKTSLYTLKLRAATFLYGPPEQVYYLAVLIFDNLRKYVRACQGQITKEEGETLRQCANRIAGYCLRVTKFHPKVCSRAIRLYTMLRKAARTFK